MHLLGITTHSDTGRTSPVDYWRIISPLTYLKAKGWDVAFGTGAVTEDEAKRADIVYSSYSLDPKHFSWTRVLTSINKAAHVMDFDDHVLSPNLKNPVEALARQDDPHRDFNTQVILSSLPYITVSTDYLYRELSTFIRDRELATPVFRLPNAIDPAVYLAPEKTAHEGLVVGFYGSTSHQADVYDNAFVRGLSRARGAIPGLRFQVIGNFVPDSLKTLGKVELIEGSPDFHGWVDLWKEHVCQWDVAIAPLRDTPFNRARSDIKFQETALARVPLIASDIGVYPRGYVRAAKTAAEWAEELVLLLGSEQIRYQVGDLAYGYVMENCTIDKRLSEWEDVFTRIHQLTTQE